MARQTGGGAAVARLKLLELQNGAFHVDRTLFDKRALRMNVVVENDRAGHCAQTEHVGLVGLKLFVQHHLETNVGHNREALCVETCEKTDRRRQENNKTNSHNAPE